ncbi:MAG: response regulator [Desulfobacteraceae bacterium]|jgi:PAS domain S-box-containing protein|nr:response regulator [Desulfobacteraceae bacterium]
MVFSPKILIIDDERRMCESLRILFGTKGYDVSTAGSGEEAREILQNRRFDVALVDMVIPETDGHQLMDLINEKNPDTDVIVITGNDSLDFAIGALKRGAYDYVRKPFEFEELLITVENALKQKKLKKENKLIHGKLAWSESRYRRLVENSPDIIYALDEAGNFTFISNAAERLLCVDREQLINKHYSTIIHEDDQERAKWFFNERRTGERSATGIELRLISSGESEEPKTCEVRHLTIELKSTGIYDKNVKDRSKKFLGTYGVARDISDRKRLETQLRHAQKMEAVGTLAGGIAHDFNNLLMGIQGYASLIMLKTDREHPNYKNLNSIEMLVQNGADLTKQLLGFARDGKFDVKSTNMNEIAQETLRMFGRTKREISIYEEYEEAIWPVDVDQGQLQQVLLNLFVNAGQAMPGGGDLTLVTNNLILGAHEAKEFGLPPARYVRISISDSGIGIDEGTRQRIFEPFFTTKKRGHGTGLGLASAYGIIQNHQGTIDVVSQVGEGATFHIYLPASEIAIKDEKPLINNNLNGPETVLLVDDEEFILKVGSQILEELGYAVLTAASGKEALEIYSEKKDEIDIVVLDMIMPGMGGGETFDSIKALNPDAKVLLSSGYSIMGEASDILSRGCQGFIQKPFTMKSFSEKLREILDGENNSVHEDLRVQ